MNRIITVLSFFMLIMLNKGNSQDLNQGFLIIDGKIVTDSINCYNFKKLQIAFPVNNQMFLHDRVYFAVRFSNIDTTLEDGYAYFHNISQSDAVSNFRGKKYGVITIFELYDDGRTRTVFDDALGILTKEQFYVIVGRRKMPFKPMRFTIGTEDIMGYKERYDDRSNAFIKYPYYGNTKPIFQNTFKFHNVIQNGVIETHNDPFATGEALGLLFTSGKNIAQKNKKKNQDKEYAHLITECTMPQGNEIKLVMNTHMDLYTSFGYLKDFNPTNQDDSQNVSQTNNTSEQENVNQNKKEEKEEEKAKHGPFEEVSNNGTYIIKGEYDNGKKTGKWTKIENGVVRREEEFKDDLLHGKYIRYNASGAKTIEENYINGKKNGEAIKYNTTTGLVNQTQTYKDDALDGPYKKYGTDGILREEGNYIKGMKDGVWKTYDTKGKLTKTQKFKNGIIEQ